MNIHDVSNLSSFLFMKIKFTSVKYGPEHQWASDSDYLQSKECNFPSLSTEWSLNGAFTEFGIY